MNLGAVPAIFVQGIDSFILLSIPLFVLVGVIMNAGGISQRLLDLAVVLVGHFRAGIAHVNIVASMIFSGMSGTTTSDVAGLGRIEIPMMIKEGFRPETAAVVTAVSATIGPIIPPSVPFILYGALTSTSVGKLFMGGVIPGVLLGLWLMAVVAWLAHRGHISSARYTRGRASFGTIVTAVRRSAWALLTPVILIGGIVTGWFTPTEAAGVAVVYAIFITRYVYRSVSWRELFTMFCDSAEYVGVIMIIVAAASVFGWLVIQAGAADIFLELIRSAESGADDDAGAAQPDPAGHGHVHRSDLDDHPAFADPGAADPADRYRPGPFRRGVRPQHDDRDDHAAGGHLRPHRIRHRGRIDAALHRRSDSLRHRDDRVPVPHPVRAAAGHVPAEPGVSFAMKPPRKTLRAQAYERLEQMIVTQVLKPGATVTEEELARTTGIGRTPIREALQRLARDGLVSIRPRSAIVILEMTVARQLQLLETRAALQEVTVRLAAKRADVDQRARMLQLAKAVEDAAEIGDGELYLRISREIHNVLCDAAGNEFLQRFMGSLYTLSRQFSFTHLGEVDVQRAAGTHAAILRAVAARDEAAAALASQRMIDFLLDFTEGSKRRVKAAVKRKPVRIPRGSTTTP